MKILLLLYFYKFIKNPLNVIFSILFPIAWLIISYFAWGRQTADSIGGFSVQSNYFIFSAPGYFLLAATSISLMNVPNIIASDRIHNRIKTYRTLNINKYQYLASNCIVNFSIFLIVFFIQIILANFAFGLLLSPEYFFAIFFINIFVFILMLFISIFLSQFGKTDRSVILISLLAFYPILFFSGNTIPPFSIDPNGVWFKYIQFLEPVGAGTYMTQNLILQSIFGHSQIDWKVDFLGIVIPIIEAIVCGTIAMKNFKWK